MTAEAVQKAMMHLHSRISEPELQGAANEVWLRILEEREEVSAIVEELGRQLNEAEERNKELRRKNFALRTSLALLRDDGE